jgi:hypothetical protein
MPSEITIRVEVSPILKEFYQGYCQSRLELERKSHLLNVVASLLKPQPFGILPHDCDKNESIEIVLPYLSHMGVNVEYRNYIDEEGMAIIQYELDQLFKSKLHNFVAGFIAGASHRYPFNTYGTMKRAIETFGDMYNISYEHIHFDTLKKSIDRSLEKKLLKKVV